VTTEVHWSSHQEHNLGHNLGRRSPTCSSFPRQQVDRGALHAELLAAMDQTMQPTQASLWLSGPANTRSLL
jgi:hypothetical protein